MSSDKTVVKTTIGVSRLVLALLITSTFCQGKSTDLWKFNQELKWFNHFGAELAWNISTQLGNSKELLSENEELLLKKNMWSNQWCLRLLDENLSEFSELRQLYLICRGPRFSSYQLSNVLALLSQLRSTYDTTKTCISNGHCYRMEPDLNNFMETVRDENLLREAWTKWHSTIGQDLSETYVQLIRLMNTGARQAGHRDIGTCWREDMETTNLYSDALKLNSEVKYLYTLLHSFVRHKIGEFYKIDLKNGPIPVHLLGNMWSQRWDSLINIVWPCSETDKECGERTSSEYIRKHIGKNATVDDMVRYAENFYVNMGFPRLPQKFFENSYFQSNSTDKNCHGSAANMYGDGDGDYRVMICASVKDSDLQTIIHEMGHIHYFRAYKHLPTIFQDGANSAFHEAVGDSVTYGMYPDPTLKTLMKIGLTKLPQISFGLIVDLWRWKIFEEENSVRAWNDYWWELNYEYLGVSKPDGYNTDGLDALGKYHIVDNIPYIRYYFGSFLQQMFYEEMCGENQFCDLKGRGEGLRRMMSRGTSTHWSEILKEFTGSDTITSSALLKYFKPLQTYLEEQVKIHNLSLGW